jgi:hypothetical protein
MDRVEMTKAWVGVLHMQVCAVDVATDEEILAVCNRDNPLHGTSRWKRVVRGDDPNDPPVGFPGPCDDHPGRTHLLVVW